MRKDAYARVPWELGDSQRPPWDWRATHLAAVALGPNSFNGGKPCWDMCDGGQHRRGPDDPPLSVEDGPGGGECDHGLGGLRGIWFGGFGKCHSHPGARSGQTVASWWRHPATRGPLVLGLFNLLDPPVQAHEMIAQVLDCLRQICSHLGAEMGLSGQVFLDRQFERFDLLLDTSSVVRLCHTPSIRRAAPECQWPRSRRSPGLTGRTRSAASHSQLRHRQLFSLCWLSRPT